MEFLPTTTGTRPRLALEIRPEGVVAARGDAGTGLITAISRAEIGPGLVVPGLRAGNVAGRPSVVSAVRRALEGVAKGGDRGKYVTLILPDVSVRVLLLEFDALPPKPTEALPVVRFRLKKLLPFDVDQSVVSYQIMSSTRGSVQVLAVAVPCDVLGEYEAVVTEAGYLPGAVLPSTLAALAGLEDADGSSLVVNAGPGGVTTAIVRGGVVLLHRTVDLGADFGLPVEDGVSPPILPLVDRENSVEEWARQDPRPEYGGDEFDRLDAMAEMQTGVISSELDRQMQTSETQATPSSAADDVVTALNRPTIVSTSREVVQAVSVAAAYFEDTLSMAPTTVLAAGTMGSDKLRGVLVGAGFEGITVREMVTPAMMEATSASASVPRGWLAGVRGALKS